MSRARQARRVAVTAVFGGGGVGLVGAGAAALLAVQARLARRTIRRVGIAEPPAADGVYGGGEGPPLRLALLGDSSAAGLGVHQPADTPGARLAEGLAAVTGRPVALRNVAVSGARSADLDRQVDLVLDADPEVAVIMIGANDVTHRVPPQQAVRALDAAVRRLRGAGAAVVVATCPDLGTVEPIPQPLRWVARRQSRQLAAAQTIAVVEAGGRSVSLGDVLGPEFAVRKELFSADGFHPSAEGYAAAATVLLPSVCAAVGAGGPEDGWTSDVPGEGVLPVAHAAVAAADTPGTEVTGASVGGRDRGPAGRWATVRHRLRVPPLPALPHPTLPHPPLPALPHPRLPPLPRLALPGPWRRWRRRRRGTVVPTGE